MSSTEQNPAEPFPLVSFGIRGKRAEALGVQGKSARIWLQPDGSVTWELVDRVDTKHRSRPWWKLF